MHNTGYREGMIGLLIWSRGCRIQAIERVTNCRLFNTEGLSIKGILYSDSLYLLFVSRIGDGIMIL